MDQNRRRCGVVLAVPLSPWTPPRSCADPARLRSTPAPPLELQNCPVCGKPNGTEPSWFDGQRLVHARCIDWGQRSFPYDWELERLRKLSRALRVTTRIVDEAGMWLASVKARWPADAQVRLDQWAVRRTRLREQLRSFVERLDKLK